VPFAVRLKRRLGRRWSVGAFSRTSPARRPRPRRRPIATRWSIRTLRSTSGPLSSLSRWTRSCWRSRDYFPYGLVGYDAGLGGRLRVGGLLAAGWSIADLHADEVIEGAGRVLPLRPPPRPGETGRGKRLRRRRADYPRGWPSRPVSACLVEGGFAWNDVTHVSGTLASTQRMPGWRGDRGGTGAGGTDRRAWVNQPVACNGHRTVPATIPWIGGQGSPFTLNLSGWTAGRGVSFGL